VEFLCDGGVGVSEKKGCRMGHHGAVDRGGAEMAAAITRFDFILRVIAEGQ